MIVRYLLAALVAGLIAGALQTAVQHAKVVPLILEAEKYEDGAPAHDHAAGLQLSLASAAQAQETTPDTAPVAAAEEEGGMLFGVNRTVWSSTHSNVPSALAPGSMAKAFSTLSRSIG